jgi:hypothetical protein
LSRGAGFQPASGVWTFLLPTNLTGEPALKARSISAQGNTLGKPAQFVSCALQGRSSFSPHVSITRQEPHSSDLEEEHHQRKSFQAELRALLERYEMAFDERYLWD